jgi:hypothetical protein
VKLELPDPLASAPRLYSLGLDEVIHATFCYRAVFRAQYLAVQRRLPCLAVTMAARAGELLMSAGRHCNVIAQPPAFGNDVSEGIDHHRAAARLDSLSPP